MKLLRLGRPGRERPAMLNPAAPGPVALPWRGLGKFLCIGLNYADHAAEAGLPVPKEPFVFMEPSSVAVGADHAVVLPPGSVKSDGEVELGVAISTRARHVSEADALSPMAGYCVVNDLSDREWQLERDGSWDRGKGCHTFGPVGPRLVTADEVPDPQALELWLDVNGQPRQRGSTRTMVFGVAQQVAYCSRFMTLQPGDLISTGMPRDVGMGTKPQPHCLKSGDTLRLGILGLGEPTQRVQAWDEDLLDD